MTRKIAVIDGNSLMHRAFHAVPPHMTAADGTPTNAAFGFMSMLLKFVEEAGPDALVCAFDAGKPQFRIEALEQYKAQRPPMDDALRVQFPLVERLLEAMGIPVVKVRGWEGDDILGTVAARSEALGCDVLLVTGDKDAYQLVTERTHVVTTRKGVTDIVEYDAAEVEARYGVTPAQFPDFLGFMGDSSDNIPGVPSIGAKTAAKLLQRFGSMDGVYENLHELKGKQLENIRDNRDLAYLSRKIATIVCDLDFELDLEAVSFPSFDAAEVTRAFGELSFGTHLKRLMKLAGAEGAAVDSAAEALSFAEPVEGDEARALVERALEAGERLGTAIVVPAQQSLLPEPTVVAFATCDAVAVLEGDEGLETLARVVREGSFSAFDVKHAVQRVYPADSQAPALLSDEEVTGMRGFDLGLAAYLLNSSTSAYTMESLAADYLSGSLPAARDDRARTCLEAQVAARLVEPLRAALQHDGSLDVLDRIDQPLVSVLAVMERTGAAIDVARLERIGAEAQVEVDDLRARIIESAGEEFNVDSPKQLARILFEVLGLPHGKKTKAGYSTDANVLKQLTDAHPIASLVLHYREYAKIKSTYIDALPRIAAQSADGRIHSSFNQTVTTTGRLSSSDPNLQNIPVRSDFGRTIRSCFVGLRDGDLFMSADYSQIELRLLAHLSGDEHLVSAFRSGADFHAATAARVFGVAPEEVTPEMRSRAKAVNFGIVYGQQAFGLAQTLDIPLAEARSMIDRYFEAYPGVRAYLDRTVQDATECGYAETLFGRKRRIPELRVGRGPQRGFGERTAMNHPMQGTAADIIKLAMVRVQALLEEGGFRARLIVQVHDELDFSVPADEVERLATAVREAMEGVVELSVPLIADVTAARTWAEAH
ncbi:DNA polymerase I [Berryella wangjianweii]|uniref:DNA polymerase I n=1 Tax=Berryella wangjianweii TaxID=2734634 RepID=A0A6M8J5D1_9ACTN|nr:DNA polymerase I [Berryella wangjianweii]QKF06699.1 DNA polymerase I [Berryella wangjianweii]